MHGTKRMRRVRDSNVAFAVLEQNNRVLRSENESLRRRLSAVMAANDGLTKKIVDRAAAKEAICMANAAKKKEKFASTSDSQKK